MNEIFSNFENIIILYAPSVLLYLTQFIDWFVTLKKFRALDIKNQVAPVLNRVQEIADQVSDLSEEIKEYAQERCNLAEQIEVLNITVSAQTEQIESLKEFLRNLSQENVELKAELRRKVECEVTEQENA